MEYNYKFDTELLLKFNFSRNPALVVSLVKFTDFFNHSIVFFNCIFNKIKNQVKSQKRKSSNFFRSNIVMNFYFRVFLFNGCFQYTYSL